MEGRVQVPRQPATCSPAWPWLCPGPAAPPATFSPLFAPFCALPWLCASPQLPEQLAVGPAGSLGQTSSLTLVIPLDPLGCVSAAAAPGAPTRAGAGLGKEGAQSPEQEPPLCLCATPATTVWHLQPQGPIPSMARPAHTQPDASEPLSPRHSCPRAQQLRAKQLCQMVNTHPRQVDFLPEE
ncbi:PREDICTED: proline-rich protein 36-like isoform X2 [Chinchilla lanigera]|uniref:proline-rich protein 36-like isoform X2 n=1 Tax=Chinchilla lanigera TaxID=34839 RepID=UPI000695AA8F|nr:PREDICTED: proline-rich protein 36-like isoform X2 [Chinchilla lanigera]